MHECMETAYKLAQHWSDKVRADMEDEEAIDNFKDAVEIMGNLCGISESKAWEKFHAARM